jgi:predicted ABC-type transport system involved in lysophospholipase L1 biosynthesis ATPase subunit
MYKLSAVTKNYAKGRETVAALRGVDLVIEDGEWLAIQDPTGTASRRCCRSSAGWTAAAPSASA